MSTQTSPFLLWFCQNDDDVYSLDSSVPGITRGYQLSRGVSRAVDWPHVNWALTQSNKTQNKMADCMKETPPVVSSAVRQILEEQQVQEVEYLPVTLDEPGGGSHDYFMVNPLGTVDCIDLEASEVSWNPINDKLIDGCEALVLQQEAVPEERLVFRPASWPKLVLVRTELARALLSAGMTGLSFWYPENYTGTGLLGPAFKP